LFNCILHLKKDIKLAKLSQSVTETLDPAAWKVGSVYWLPSRF